MFKCHKSTDLAETDHSHAIDAQKSCMSSQMYYYGVVYWLWALGRSLGFAGAACIFLPLIHPLGLASINQVLNCIFFELFN